MLTSSDANSSQKIVPNSKDGGLELQRDPVGVDEAVYRHEDDKGDVEPVDMLVPVRERDGSVCDMNGLLLVEGRARGRIRGFFSSHGWMCLFARDRL